MIQITAPWPAKQLFPNWRNTHHWRTYWPHQKAQRGLAYGLALEAGAKPAGGQFLPERIAVEVNFYPPDRRNRDEDGCIGSVKNLLDGIADALGVDDKRFKLTWFFHAPEKPGKVVVRIG